MGITSCLSAGDWLTKSDIAKHILSLKKNEVNLGDRLEDIQDRLKKWKNKSVDSV